MYLNSRIFRLLCHKNISNAFAFTVPRCTPSNRMSKLRLISLASAKKRCAKESIDSNSRCIFFGGIQPDTTEKMVAEYFSEFGDVEDVRIVKTIMGRSRDYGFASFKSPKVAEEVLSVKHSIQGKPIIVGRSTKHRVIYIGGLHSHLTKTRIKNYFSKFGTVETVNFINNSKHMSRTGYAFITFSTTEEASKATLEESQVIDDCTVKVKLRESANHIVVAEAVQSKRIKVDGLPYETITVEKLRDQFETFGDLKGIDLLINSKTKSCAAIVEFQKTDSVQNALAIENYQIDDCVVNLFRFPEKDKPGEREKTLYLENLAPQTTEESLLNYFSHYGKLVRARVIRDQQTGCSQGCGVVKFRKTTSLESFENISRHVIDGFPVTARRVGLKFHPKLVLDEISGFNFSGRLSLSPKFI